MQTRAFFEQDSLEARHLLAFLERESPACEVLLASDPHQAALLAANLKAEVIVVQGGLSDGRAEKLLTCLRDRGMAIRWILLLDRRKCQSGTNELPLEKAQEQLKASLGRGWLLLRFAALRKL